MPIKEATYEQVALEDPEGQWELVCGRLRSKPAMTTEHNSVQQRLDHQLQIQINDEEYSVSANGSRLHVSSGSYYVPDICVVPRALRRRLLAKPGTFEVYDDPMPLVVEVWSPCTGDRDGDYDVEEKLREYQRRGDLEIWRIHPYERTLTAWRRQPDGDYTETVYRSGSVRPLALPGVTIELERLFD